jgi:hypothetical protein
MPSTPEGARLVTATTAPPSERVPRPAPGHPGDRVDRLLGRIARARARRGPATAVNVGGGRANPIGGAGVFPSPRHLNTTQSEAPRAASTWTV